jgi:hypothetical protein
MDASTLVAGVATIAVFGVAATVVLAGNTKPRSRRECTSPRCPTEP